MARGRHTRRRFGRGWVLALVTAATVALVGVGSSYAAYRYDRAASVRILPGVTVAGVDVGDMTRAEALSAVAAVARVSLDGDLKVTAGDRSWVVTPSALGTRARIRVAVSKAFRVAGSIPLVSRVYHRIAGKPVGTRIGLGYGFDPKAVTAFVEQAASEIGRPAIDAGLTLQEGALVSRHAQAGQALDAEAATKRLLGALERHAGKATLPILRLEPQVTDASLGATIVVDLSDNTLELYDGFQVIRSYRVATAADGYVTPAGTWQVINKAENPTWTNPAPDTWGKDLPLSIPPGPGNPLGTRALYLNAPGIRIHGTYATDSIGTYASHGCIRMTITDSEALYPLVPIGTPVLVKP